MADRSFLDSNLLLYAVGDDAARRQVAEALLAQRPVVSARVLAETAAVLRRKFGHEPSAIVKILDAVLARVHCEPVSAETVLSALRWGERLGYSHYDSQIIAAALAADCSVLYSQDMQHGQLIDNRLTIVNPFVA
jgi:predicted nucleic acid-binding protein